MGTTAEVRKYREAAREQGKTSLEEARKLMTAWIGATDAAYQRVRTELKDFDTRAAIAKMQEGFKDTYAEMAKRGEKVIGDLRHSPQTRMVFDRAEQVLRRTEKRVEHAEKEVTGTPAKAARTTRPATHKTPSRH